MAKPFSESDGFEVTNFLKKVTEKIWYSYWKNNWLMKDSKEGDW